MENYTETAGHIGLFDNAPPLAEVVLEDISKAKKRIIFAQAFKPGATWWHSDGRRGRRGLHIDQMSDFICAATRRPRASAMVQLENDQLIWDINHHKGEPVSMYTNTRPCMSCGQPVSDGMIHACKVPLPAISEPLTACRKCGVLGAHFCTGRQTARPKPVVEVFTSVFEPQHADAWIRINTAGRIKFSEGLMLRFVGMKIDVAVSTTGRVRVCESDHGKTLSARGYLFARRVVPLVDFNGGPSALIYLHENVDGCLYGQLIMKGGKDGAALEG